MLSNLYVQKSFVLLGHSLPGCLGCSYCRLDDGSADHFYTKTLPSEVNPAFTNLPVAVNLFYGDPTLQPANTHRILYKLEGAGHTGPVVVVLKGDFYKLSDWFPRLNVHFAFSTFGIDSRLDGGSRKTFLSNLCRANKRKVSGSIEFRPIVYGINDSQETIDWVMDKAAEFDMPVGYSGLQGKPSLVPLWERQKLPLKPYPGYRFGHKKMISDEVEQRILESAEKRGVHVFRKTSCLISYAHNLKRDYNAHYYRPNEVGCYNCPMLVRCHGYKKRAKEVNTSVLPYSHTVVFKAIHTCLLKQNGTCEFPTEDCSKISGYIIKTDTNLTTADVRVTKWLTGLTVDANFVESPYLSDFWRTNGNT